jgi:cyclic beta-1,2-glucan synthetase
MIAKKMVSQAPAKPSYNLLDASDRGTDVIGTARGSVMPTFDEAAGKDILEFDYHLSKGSSIRAWGRNFPLELAGPGINTVKVGLRLLDSVQAKQISIALEVKGNKAVQRIPMQLKTGWNSLQETIDWARIGELDEVAFVVTPKSVTGEGELIGTINLSVDFIKVKASGKPAGTMSSAPGFNLFDAGEKGVFNIGASKGDIRNIFDEGISRDVWAFDYSLPPASIVGIWTKSYPAELDSSAADSVKISINVPNPEQINQVAVKLEIKGNKSMQSVPLFLNAGRNCFRESVNWNAIGTLTEAVFVVSPMAVNPELGNALDSNPMEGGLKEGGKALTGTLSFELEFEKLTFLQKNMALIKVGLVSLLALLLALIVSLLKKLFGHSLKEGELFSSRAKAGKATVAVETTLSGLKWDVFYGSMLVLSTGAVFKIYMLGMKGYLDAGFGYSFLGLGVLGVVIAGLLKFRYAGKHLTPSEIFQNLFLSGLLAASSSKMELLQAPATWNQLFMISNLTAAVTFVLYHAFNAYSLATSGKHLKAVPAGLIVGTPYLFGWLLLLENVTMIQLVMNRVTGGLLAAWPLAAEILSRLIVAMGFNEVVVNGISLVTKGKLLKEPKAHLYIFVVSLCVVIAPLIAHLGATAAVAALPMILRGLIAVVTTALSFAGLWGEVYLITGVLLDGGHHLPPTTKSIFKHVNIGMRKAMAYSGILMAILYVFTIVLTAPASLKVMSSAPIVVGLIAGALLFPFLKTIIETFDGSLPFFERTCYSYKTKTLYARGAVVGFGFACMISQGLFQKAMPDRILFGLMVGLLSSGGMSFVRDAVYALKGQGKIQSWRLYLVDSLLGIFVGSAAAFYLDASQVPVIMEKFKLYTSSGLSPVDYITYPLINKWGRIDLGSYTGGVKLIFLESLAGVINWSVAAWLFAINKVFMQAFFDKDKTPIKFFFSKDGFAMLVEHMIYVLRWGLWMSPIIFTFLRMMPEPTWYNQDGAIRTLFAIYHNFTMNPQAFQAWSLQMFIYVMAFDLFRILIWMDHMGLRVATLVNLSFLGMDKLDEKASKFIGTAAAQRYIPEGVKRFTTWGPLLIPFYLPRGQAWDYAWSTSEAMQNASRNKGLIPALQNLSMTQMVLLVAVAILVCTGFSILIRAWGRRLRAKRIAAYTISNRDYRVTLKENGEVFSEVLSKEFFDVTRRSYDQIDPCGRILYLVDAAEPVNAGRSYWPVAGNFPSEIFSPSVVERGEDVLKISNFTNGIKAMVEIGLPDQDSTAEVWTITLQNLTAKQRQIKMVPYLEWVLNGWIHDRFHTQYARLYPEMEYVTSANAILSWHKATKSMGFMATDLAPEGFLSGRVDFIGRARSIWSPRIFETMAFLPAKDIAPYPTFDPIGSLMVNASIGPKGSATMRMVIGYAKNKKASLEIIQKFLKPRPDRTAALPAPAKRPWLIGHGEIPPGTPQPYSSFADQGNKLVVHTPYTPRPIDHAMSNAVHSVMVTNRGLHTSCNGNSQQNRLTPDWADTVTREIPSEAIYLYDPDSREWFSPTFFPLSDPAAKYDSEFSVDGTAVFHMNRGTIATELTVFVPPSDPAGVYLLTVKNNSNQPRRMRVAPYFQMVLGFMPEKSGPLNPKYDKGLNALFFDNPRNIFRSGPAFASMSVESLCVETKRGRFFGTHRGVKHPLMVEQGRSDASQQTDEAQIAGFLGMMEIPANGEFTVAFILGQTEDRKQADSIIRKYKDIDTVRKNLAQTRKWWLDLMGTLEVRTDSPEFDYYQNWLKYQAVAERIWPRRGYYQTSGAYGFRDQLQDTINLMWVDPALARKQILLCASQQFLEGDVFHWFFTLTDGRSAFSCRSHASDNPLWLAWAVAEYIRGTGDESVLDELTPYMHSEFPFAQLPKNKAGWGHLYHRTTRGDTVYRHCLRSIDLVIGKRSGKNGLPLMGTGDWNDGLDEIGSEGKGESVWLGFFLYYILKGMVDIIEKKDGPKRREYYVNKMNALKVAIEKTWRDDRYLRAFHDDGTEIGLKGSGIWEIDALTAAWAVMSGINFERGVTVFNTALSVLEKDDAILLGWPALREDTKPYLGRSSKYPEGVRENGMYCHGVQWLVRAARIIAEQYEKQGNQAKADEYRETAYRLWLKISPISHMTPELIEIYGGQPNKQSADVLTNFERGRMIWHGYTGAAGWMLRQAMEGIVGASLVKNKMSLPSDLDRPRGRLHIKRVHRDTAASPLSSKPNGKSGTSSAEQVQQKGRFSVLAPELTTAAD